MGAVFVICDGQHGGLGLPPASLAVVVPVTVNTVPTAIAEEMLSTISSLVVSMEVVTLRPRCAGYGKREVRGGEDDNPQRVSDPQAYVCRLRWTAIAVVWSKAKLVTRGAAAVTVTLQVAVILTPLALLFTLVAVTWITAPTVAVFKMCRLPLLISAMLALPVTASV